MDESSSSTFISELKQVAQNQKLQRFGPILFAPFMVFLLLTTMSKYNSHTTMIRRSLVMPQVIMTTTPNKQCKPNAIVYFVQKHDTNLPTTTSETTTTTTTTTNYGQFTKSLDLLFDNYMQDHYESTSVFLFHIGDFGEDDLEALEWRYPAETQGTLQLVNLADSMYWTLPSTALDDNNEQQLLLSDEQLLAAHKTRFLTTGVYDYLERTNHLYGCSYEHVLQMDESSLMYSKPEGDIFADMTANNHMLQYRLCDPYDASQVSNLVQDYGYTNSGVHLRDNLGTCAPSPSFLISSLHYMKSRPVQRFLSFCESRMYSANKPLSQTTILAGMTFGMLGEEEIHRRLDFTFSSMMEHKSHHCPIGTLQAGYEDSISDRTMSEFMFVYETKRHCGATLVEESITRHVESEFVLNTIVVMPPTLLSLQHSAGTATFTSR